MSSLHHGIEHRLLVGEHPGVLRDPGHRGMQASLCRQVLEERALLERPGERDVRSLDELGPLPSFPEHGTGLLVEVGVRERESGELVAEELVVHFLRECDGVQSH